MFYLVKLQSSERYLVPQQWIKDIDEDLAKIFNYGITYLKNKLFTVYISKNYNNEADFQLGICNELKNDRAACYKASIVKCFGEYTS